MSLALMSEYIIMRDVPKDMIAIPLGHQLALVPVASPDFVNKAGIPSTPKYLAGFRCINRCFPGGEIYRWKFIDTQGGIIEISVAGDLVVDSDSAIIQAAESGLGIAFVYENLFGEQLKKGSLIRLLPDYNSPVDNFASIIPAESIFYYH